MYIGWWVVLVTARLLLDDVIEIGERYRVQLKAYKVPRSDAYPLGVKARYVLVNVFNREPVILVDNHLANCFHVHANVFGGFKVKRNLGTSDYIEALEKFWDLVWECFSHESQDA